MASHEFTDKSRPLPPDTRRLVLDQLREMPFLHEFSVLLYLYTGVGRIDGCHLQQKMVSETKRGLHIELLPGEHQCRSGGYSGKNPDWGLGEPCQYCSEHGGTYSFSDPRMIPVRNERAVDVISRWFQVYDYTPSSGTMAKRIKEVGTEVGVPRLSPSVLRHSFGVILAGKDFSRDVISDVMGRDRSNPEHDLVFQTYGRLCEGANPYRCGSSTTSGDPCEELTRPGELCDFHRPDSGCKATTGDEQPCQRRASTDNGFCYIHSRFSHRCGAQTDDGSTCSSVVWSPEELCVFHRDNEPVCGADARDGVCQRPVEDAGLRCHRHGGYICGETDTQRGVACRVPVDGPDAVCMHHSDSGYICGADGGKYSDRCQFPVEGEDDQCFIHKDSNPTCGVENRYGKPCMRRVDGSGERCLYHSESGYICGAEIGDGVCKRRVTDPDSRCRIHSGNRFKCGAEKTRGGTCQRAVDDPEGRCQFHSGHRCGAKNKFGEPCQQYVSDPDQRCQYHSD